MKSYREIRSEIAPEVANGSKMACSSCKSMTEHETLRNLGGMCHACFEHYCADAFNFDSHQARYQLGLAKALKRRIA